VTTIFLLIAKEQRTGPWQEHGVKDRRGGGGG